MTDEIDAKPQIGGPIAPDVLEVIRSKLVDPDKYSDEDLSMAAYLLGTCVVSGVSSAGFTPFSNVILMTATNIFAGATFPMLVNRGVVNVKKAAKLVTEMNEADDPEAKSQELMGKLR